MRRIVCVTLPQWATERLIRENKSERLIKGQSVRQSIGQAEPFATTMSLKGARRLIGLNPAAARAGLASGMALAAARALVPDLVVADADPAAEAADLEALARWCTRWTPWVSVAQAPCSGGAALMLDVTGCAHLFGGEQAILADMALRLRKLGLTAALAMASTPGAAWALATHDRRASQGLVVLDGDVRAAVCALPVEALRIDAGTAHGLRALGLKRIGSLAGLAPAAIARRFGAGLVRALDRALGVEDEVVNPLAEVVPCRVRLRLVEPLGTLEGLEIGLGKAIAELTAVLEDRCEGARQVQIGFYRVDGVLFTLSAGAARAHRDPVVWTRLLSHCLSRDGERFDLGFGVDLIEAAVPILEPVTGEVVDLDPVAAAALKSADAVHRLAERLSARIGASRVNRLVAVDSWVPEKTQGVMQALLPRPTGELSAKLTEGVFRRGQTPPPSGSRLTPPPLDGGGKKHRPPLLLTHPEPVDAIAEVPDGPPRLFRWRHQPFKVTRAEGPERLICDSPEPRDYYRIETDQGRRFWLYRQGLPGAPPAHLPAIDPPAPVRWFLHSTG
ncbi:MAG: DNA polymerase Y family protein [Hyphomonadaceae bacterium]|jgi:protein ImuB|nr:DNA polymerase Y family protein [Hyphomonadaceae bacterium]